MLTGEIGCGKTLLSRTLVQHLSHERYHLTPFSTEEVADYIDFRMQAAGASRVVFVPEAMQAIYEASDGVPRRINTIADLALLIGFMERHKQIGPEVVKKAFKEAQ